MTGSGPWNAWRVARSVGGVANVTASHPTVVMAIPITSRRVGESGGNAGGEGTNWEYTATTKEITMPAISLHALIRHQNQRNRKISPVPAPICSRIWNAW